MAARKAPTIEPAIILPILVSGIADISAGDGTGIAHVAFFNEQPALVDGKFSPHRVVVNKIALSKVNLQSIGEQLIEAARKLATTNVNSVEQRSDASQSRERPH